MPGQDAPFAGGATAPARHLWCPHPQARQRRPDEWGCQLKDCDRLLAPLEPLSAVRTRQAAAPRAPGPCAAPPRWLPGPERGAPQTTLRSLFRHAGHLRRRRRSLTPPCRLCRHLLSGDRRFRRRSVHSALRRSRGGVGTPSKTNAAVSTQRDTGAAAPASARPRLTFPPSRPGMTHRRRGGTLQPCQRDSFELGGPFCPVAAALHTRHAWLLLTAPRGCCVNEVPVHGSDAAGAVRVAATALPPRAQHVPCTASSAVVACRRLTWATPDVELQRRELVF